MHIYCLFCETGKSRYVVRAAEDLLGCCALSPRQIQHTWSGGKSILSADGYALYKKSGTTATVTELCAGSDPAALTGPLLRTGAEDFVLCLPAGSPAAGKRCQTRRAGMAVPLTKTGKTLQRQLKDLYIGFTL